MISVGLVKDAAAMDRRKTGYGNKVYEGSAADDLILAHHHRVPHIQTKVVDTIAYSVRRPALVIRGGSKKYGSSLVLHNLNVFAKEGTIYCLVGASNTGKSTILSCVTGLRRLTSGELLVFGAQPGSSPSGIPGRRIGYMPQEVGLHTELTMTEVLQYHGRMYGMTLAQIKDRSDTLAGLLDLQHFNVRLEKLSPGLQKRVSLACALIHEPELIVLDQPTTGMDILFQKGIWMHLQKLVSNGRTSVILTTQNIEEARQAHRVGVLRNGRLLIEDSPLSLLQKHGTHLLAEVTARLSVKDTIKMNQDFVKQEKKGKSNSEVVCMDEWTTFGIPSGSSIEDSANQSVSYKEWMEQVVLGDEDQIKLKNKSKAAKTPSKKVNMKQTDLPRFPNPSCISHRLRALFIKQSILLFRNLWLILVSLALPTLLISAFCVNVGTDFHDLKLGLVNDEVPDYKDCMVLRGCNPQMMSCRYLDLFSSGLIELVELETEDDAVKNLQDGNILGYLYFSPSFSVDTQERLVNGYSEEYSNNSVKAVLDTSNVYLSSLLKETLRSRFIQFEEDLFQDCKVDRVDRNISISIESSDVFSNLPSSYDQFLTPGLMFSIAYFVSLFTSSVFYRRERKSGLISRSMVACVNSAESLFIHVLYQLPILAAQIAIIILIPMYVFNIPTNGFWAWIACLLALGGFSGLSLSFFLSTLFSESKYIHVTGIASIITSIILSGIIWPIESQHWIVQWISYVLPWTLSTDSMRSIMIKGWEIDHPKVWPGFVSIAAWTASYWILICLVLIFRYIRR